MRGGSRLGGWSMAAKGFQQCALEGYVLRLYFREIIGQAQENLMSFGFGGYGGGKILKVSRGMGKG